MLGVVGLTGIVVNDSLILANLANQLRLAHPDRSTAELIVDAVETRLRPILLTSITTVLGVLPVLLETDLQAQFLRPLVTSLAFGLMFGTFIVLFLLPAILASLHARRQGLSGVARWFLKPAAVEAPDRLL